MQQLASSHNYHYHYCNTFNRRFILLSSHHSEYDRLCGIHLRSKALNAKIHFHETMIKNQFQRQEISSEIIFIYNK